MPPTSECPVCYIKTKHYLSCANDHTICLKCLQNLLHTCPCNAEHCCGIGWKCPCCRDNLSLNAYHLLAIGYGSIKIFDKIKNLETDSD